MASTKEIKALITLAGKIDPSLQSAMLKASSQQSKFANNAKQSGTALSKVGTIAKGVFLGNIFTKGLSLTANGLKNMSSEGVELASSLSEVQNVVNTTFGSNAKQINNWSKTALNSYGLAELQAKQYTGTLGAMLKSSNVASKYSLKMSKDLAGLSGDFASFYNLSQDEAFEKIRSGISGETEPLKQLGINMSVTNLQAFALSKGIKTQYSNMDQASQMMLRYNYLMSVSKDAQGDFAKTLDTSYANQKRLFDTKIQETLAKIAVKTMPLLTKGLQFANTLIDKIDVDRIGGGIAKVVDSVAGFLPDVMSMVGQLSSGMAGFLPDIMNVGKQIVPLVKQLIPVVMNIVTTAMPLLVQGIGLVMSLITPLMPIISQLVSALLPPLSQVIKLIFAAIGPLIPVIQMLISSLMPPIMQILAALMPLLQSLTPVIGLIASAIAFSLANSMQFVMPIIQFFADRISFLMQILTQVADFVTNVFSGNWSAAWDNIKNIFSLTWQNIISSLKGYLNIGVGFINSLTGGINKVTGIVGKAIGIDMQIPVIPTFAKGGFTNQPSIFGEAGPEAAIPIKRTPRSLALLDKTAELLGVQRQGNGFNFTYSPTYSGGTTQEIKSEFSRQKEELRDMIEEILRDGGRPSFG